MTWAVIGAGYAGIAAAAALIEAGIEVDVLDARPTAGGLWLDGIYDSVSLITSRAITAFPGKPMPPGPVFPSGPELLAYLTAVARETGVLERFRQQRVGSILRAGSGWSVDGVEYDGVVICTGLFATPRIPRLPGSLSIPALHTSAYRRPSELGSDVLVVGLGNSGADVARDCAAAGKRVTLAIHRDRHVMPRTLLGRPVTELARPSWAPDLLVRVLLDLVIRLRSFPSRFRRMGQPRHLILAESDVVHDELLPLVRSGAVAVKPAVVSLAGSSVGFADGSSAAFDTVVWATGYDWSVPVDRARLDGCASGLPHLIGGALSPVSPGLAAVGFREPRGGRGPYYAALGRVVAAAAVAQASCSQPVGALLARQFPADGGGLIDDVAELPKLAAIAAAIGALV